MIKVIMMRLLTLNVKQVAIVGRKLWWKIGNTLREDVITNQCSRKLLSFLSKDTINHVLLLFTRQ